MSECEKSVDFWVEELTKDTDPEHFDSYFDIFHYSINMRSYGQWMWNRGYNAGLVNLQTKVNTYCVPQWVSVKDKLPDKDGKYLVCGKVALSDIHGEPIQLVRFTERKEWLTSLSVKYWVPIPTLPESEDDAENSCMKEASEGEWIIHFDDLFPEESTKECSICHAEQYLRYGDDDNYCPNCGAKMKQAGKG